MFDLKSRLTRKPDSQRSDDLVVPILEQTLSGKSCSRRRQHRQDVGDRPPNHQHHPDKQGVSDEGISTEVHGSVLF
jgi:hypothetical protein